MLLNTGIVIFSFFFLSHFAPVAGKIETLQHTMILSHHHKNNQDSIYELFIVYVEETNV